MNYKCTWDGKTVILKMQPVLYFYLKSVSKHEIGNRVLLIQVILETGELVYVIRTTRALKVNVE